MTRESDAVRWLRSNRERATHTAAREREVADRALAAAVRADEEARRLGLWIKAWVDSAPLTTEVANDVIVCRDCDGAGRFEDGWCQSCAETGVAEPASDGVDTDAGSES